MKQNFLKYKKTTIFKTEKEKQKYLFQGTHKKATTPLCDARTYKRKLYGLHVLHSEV